MLDANTVIALLRGSPAALRDRLTRHAPGDVVVSSIVFAEVAAGSLTGKPPSPRVMEQLPQVVEIAPFDLAAARSYARLPFRRGGSGRLVAAHALSLDAILVTDDERAVADVPGLMVENWTR